MISSRFFHLLTRSTYKIHMRNGYFILISLHLQYLDRPFIGITYKIAVSSYILDVIWLNLLFIAWLFLI